MKLNLIIKITLIVLFTITLNQCKDKTKETLPVDLGHYSLDSTIAPYLYFKAGSWWVYKNDSTGEIDSQVMNWSINKKVRTTSEKRTYTYDDIHTIVRSATNGYAYDINSYGSHADIYNWEFSILYNRSRHKSGDYDGIVDFFCTKQKIGEPLGGGASELFYRGKIPVFQLNGFTFYDVLKFEVKGDPTWPDSNIPTYDNGTSFYYWAKDVGLIMVENGDVNLSVTPKRPITQKWELINYKIIK